MSSRGLPFGLASALAAWLVCTTSGCADDHHFAVDSRRVGVGAPPIARPVLHGARAFVLIEDAWSDGSWLQLKARTWPENALPPRVVDVLADCASGPDGSTSVELGARNPGESVAASIRWDDLCPHEPLPRRAPLALQLIDVCVDGACETLAGTVDFVANGEPWPAPLP